MSWEFKIFVVLLLDVLLSFIVLSRSYASSYLNRIKAISISGENFVDNYGREVILHGVNLVCKDRGRNYIDYWDETDFKKLKEWGINCIRLGIIWDGIEPSPGLFNEDYLNGIDRFIELASRNNIYVVLDMHQDLYSYKFGGDGAPEWAIIDDSEPHIHVGMLWSDAYFTSPAIKRAFDNFWDNKNAPDGLGLQDHYILCWKLIVRRYKNNSFVIGYDVMNEPFIGSDIDKVWDTMIKKFLESTGLDISIEELNRLWLTNKIEILKKISDIDIYTQIIDATEEIYKSFERDKLLPFYKRLISAIREEDEKGLIFLEPSVSANIGVYSGLERIDHLQVYAPHAYDILTDTPFINLSDLERLKIIFKRHKDTADRLQMPLFIGEWGAFGTYKETKELALSIVKMMEELKCSETYWDYLGYGILEGCDYFDAIKRPYPMNIAGNLRCYSFNYREGRFFCKWEETYATNNNTVIYIPNLSYKVVNLDPKFDFSVERIEDSNSGYIIVPSDGRSKSIEIIF